MTAVSLKEILPEALEKGYAIPGFVVLGWEDATVSYTHLRAHET